MRHDDLLLARPHAHAPWHPREWGVLAPWWRWVDERSTTGARVVLLLVVGGLAAVPVLAGLVVGMIIGTDCLMGCGDDPRPVLGTLVALPAILLGAAVVAMLPWVVGAPRHCRPTFLWTAGGLLAWFVLGLVV